MKNVNEAQREIKVENREQMLSRGNLNNDVLLEIGSNLEDPDLSALSLTCRRFYSLFAPTIETMCIDSLNGEFTPST